MYLHLARASELRRRPQVRDRLLVVSAAAAQRIGLTRIAAYCRYRVLESNPHHLIRRWDTIETALDEPDFLHFLKQLQRRYPQERAEQMLSDLEIEMGRERETYFTDEEYAASLLSVTPEKLDTMFPER
jgi:rare lipoprotein A (peptidoglycan hydrolase)